VLIAGGALWFATAAVRAPALPLLLKAGAVALVVLVLIQASLGALVVLNGRNPELATAHVFVGAVLLASTFLVSWTLHRPVLERSSIHAKELRAIEASTLEFRQA
jgi:cytochrome c oxidase assembly protein subunit 15